MKKAAIAFLACLVLIFAGCANFSAPQETQVAPAMPMPSAAPAAEAAPNYMDKAEGGGTGWSLTNDSMAAPAPEAPRTEPSSGSAYGGHKIIKEASIGIETRAFDEHVAHVRQRAQDLGGYVSSSYTQGRKPEHYNDSGRYANISVRIPQERMEEFLADTRGLASVTQERSDSQDITGSYFDTESRLKLYTTQRERIMVLLEKALKMEDIIALESEVSRLTYEIEQLTTSLKRWDDLIAFATVSVEINEIPPSTPVTSDDSFSTRASDGLSDTFNGIAVFFEGLALVIITGAPVIVLVGLIVLAVVLITRSNKKKRNAKKLQNTPPQDHSPQDNLPPAN